MQNSKDISVIIVNYRSERYLAGCIASIYNSGLKEAEIIIVNNDSEESLESLRREYPEINFVESGKNLGFGAASNRGANEARGKYLLFLNPDSEIIEAEADILEKFEKDATLGIAGARILDASGKLQEWSFGLAELDLCDLVRNNLGFPKRGKGLENIPDRELSWVSGAALFMPRNLFLEIGGFDEKFFLYYEDVDLCKNARKHGKKIRHAPEITVRHIGGGSHADKTRQKKDFYASQDHYFRKHFPAQARLVSLLRKIFV